MDRVPSAPPADALEAAAARWADALAAWKIPDEILAQAPEPPYRLPPELFVPPVAPPDTPSRRAAVAGLHGGGAVLDVGAGAGAAGLALVPPATSLAAVDESPEMLVRLRDVAGERGIEPVVVEGRWPDVEASVPVADVVVCHHVFYNVARLLPFVQALTAHARRRVVVELTARHPLAPMTPLWRHFWGIDRPEGPTAEDAVALLVAAGLEPTVERFRRPERPGALDHAARAVFTRRRLCLPPSADSEVAAILAAAPPVEEPVVCLAWAGGATS